MSVCATSVTPCLTPCLPPCRVQVKAAALEALATTQAEETLNQLHVNIPVAGEAALELIAVMMKAAKRRMHNKCVEWLKVKLLPLCTDRKREWLCVWVDVWV